MNLTSFCEGLQQYKDFVILGHEKPDGDAVGAALSMQHLLQRMGKNATVYMVDVDQRYSFLPLFDTIKENHANSEDIEALIVVDCGEVSRLGHYSEYFLKAKVTFCIDHHISKGEIATYNYLNDRASSASELVYEIIKGCSIPLDETLSNLIYEGICYDTGGFRHSNVNAKVLRIGADLVENGAIVTEIMYHLFSKRSFISTKLMGAAIDTLQLYEMGKIAVAYLDEDTLQKYNPTSGATDGIVNMIKDIEGVEVAVFFTEINNKIKASFRSEGKVNVSEFAARFGGGGHAKASGCSLDGNLYIIIDDIIKQLKEVMNGRDS